MITVVSWNIDRRLQAVEGICWPWTPTWRSSRRWA